MTELNKMINELAFQLHSKEVTEQHYPIQLSESDASKILKLLKEQKPRVLTFDEVKQSPDRLMWLQYKSANASDGYEMRPTAPYADDDPRLRASVSFQSGHVQMKGLYGKQWRCWNVMPEKERLAKWDVETDS